MNLFLNWKISEGTRKIGRNSCLTIRSLTDWLYLRMKGVETLMAPFSDLANDASQLIMLCPRDGLKMMERRVERPWQGDTHTCLIYK